MTNLVRIITDDREAADARRAAEAEFLGEVDDHDRGHLVTAEALDRWYGLRPKRSRPAAILDEFGPAVSTRLDREEARR